MASVVISCYQTKKGEGRGRSLDTIGLLSSSAYQCLRSLHNCGYSDILLSMFSDTLFTATGMVYKTRHRNNISIIFHLNYLRDQVKITFGGRIAGAAYSGITFPGSSFLVPYVSSEPGSKITVYFKLQILDCLYFTLIKHR